MEGHRVNILGFASHVVSKYSTGQLLSVKTATDNKWTNRKDMFKKNIIYKKRPGLRSPG